MQVLIKVDDLLMKHLGAPDYAPAFGGSIAGFHSLGLTLESNLPPWFTTKAEQAGQPPHIIDFVTGHKRPVETLG